MRFSPDDVAATLRIIRGLATATLLATALGVAGCSTPPTPSERGEGVAEVHQAIVGGVADTGDPAIVMIFAIKDDGGDGTLCTGTVVSPHVIATAAHCVSPEVVSAILGTTKYHFLVFLGTDNNDPAQYQDPSYFVSVKSTSFDPGYHMKDSPPVHDVGAIVTDAALVLPPVPMNRTALTAEWIGKDARAVGAGRSIADSMDSSAVRKQAAISIDGITAETVTFRGAPGLCEGDSGGPLLVTRNGVESLAGIHSYGDKKSCVGSSYDMRADVDLVPFVDPIIAENDPGFVPPDDGSKSAGPDASSSPPDAGPPTTAVSGCAVGAREDGEAWFGVLAVAAALVSARARRRGRRPLREPAG